MRAGEKEIEREIGIERKRYRGELIKVVHSLAVDINSLNSLAQAPG